ncbi:uncharacterized protein LOC143223911 [Tachypleus tridentatus]|uniref:uncharacterized protein LOC143223911 n=1 Tax=Tachypleus tridentatus TaxID=6853 RepID=UPI003FD2B5AD
MSPHASCSRVRIRMFYPWMLLVTAVELVGSRLELPDSSIAVQHVNTVSDPTLRTERSFQMSKVEPPSRPNSNWDDPYHRPYFDNSTSRNVTAPLGKAAYLHCRIHQLGDRTVKLFKQTISFLEKKL